MTKTESQASSTKKILSVGLPVDGDVTREELLTDISRSGSDFGDRLDKIRLLRDLKVIERDKFTSASCFKPLHLELNEAFDYHLNVAASASEAAAHCADMFIVFEKAVESSISQGKAEDAAVLMLCQIDPNVKTVWSAGIAAKKRILARRSAKRTKAMKRKASLEVGDGETTRKKSKEDGRASFPPASPITELNHDLFASNYISNNMETRVLDRVKSILLDAEKNRAEKIVAGGVYRVLKGSNNNERELARKIISDLYRKDQDCDPGACMHAVAYVCGLHK